MPRSTRTSTGQFRPGVSGNPNGRPPTRRDSVAFTPATPAPARSRRDGWINSSSGHGTHRDRRRLTQYGVDIVTDIEAQQLWRSEFLAAAIIEQGPREAFSRGWHCKCEDKAITEEVAEHVKRIGLTRTVVDAAMYENAYGGAAIFPVLSGSLGDLSEPLDERGITSVDALHVLEPQELTPSEWYTDIRHPKFRQPMTWRFIPLSVGRAGFVSTVDIHESRLIILPGTRVSVQTQPGQRFGWGDSQLCRPWSVISDFGLAWGSAATLLHNHGKETLEMDGFANIMAQSDGVQEFDRYLDAMSNAWSTLRMNVIDGKSKISRATGTLSGVSDLLNEFKVLMAAAARRPVSVLMGQSQSGLRTGDDDTRTWYKTVEADRADRWHHPLERIVHLLLLATTGPTGGKAPDLWSIEYPPLWAPTEKEIADTRLADMQRAKIAVDEGIASADDVAKSFYGGDTYSGDIHIDWQRREAQAAVAQQGAGDLSPEDQAAIGREGEQDDLSDEELTELDKLREEFGAEDDREDSWRVDQVGVSAGGHGYNPYRDKTGRFGSGAHKAKPAAHEAKAAIADAKAKAAKARETGNPEHIKQARTAVVQASKEARAYDGAGPRATKAASDIASAYQHVANKNYSAARTLFEKHGHAPEQQVADQLARSGFPVKIKAPKGTSAAPRAPAAKPAPGASVAAGAGKSVPASIVSQPVVASASATKSVPSSREAIAAQKAFATDPNRAIIAQGRTGPITQTPIGSARQFTDQAQAAIRDHHNAVIAQYGLHNLDASEPGGKRVSVDENMKLGGQQCYGSHGQKGDVVLWGGVADHLAKHSQLDASSLVAVGQRALGGDKDAIRAIDAYRVSTHEALHGHGPHLVVQRAGTTTDEITTEVMARKIVGDLHGIPSYQLPGSYDRMIHPVVNAAAAATGRSFPEAWAAVERASSDFKKLANFNHIDGQVADHFAGTILRHLGNNDPAAHAAFAEQYYQIGRSDYQKSVAEKYPSVNRYQ